MHKRECQKICKGHLRTETSILNHLNHLRHLYHSDMSSHCGQSARRIRSSKFSIASWNLRSLVENSGCIRSCKKVVQSVSQDGMSIKNNRLDRKLDLMMKELKRFRVAIAGIQETKWFGSDIRSSEGCTFLQSGRAVPLSDAHYLRNEEVGIFLDEKASEAWKLGGEV